MDPSEVRPPTKQTAHAGALHRPSSRRRRRRPLRPSETRPPHTSDETDGEQQSEDQAAHHFCGHRGASGATGRRETGPAAGGPPTTARQRRPGLPRGPLGPVRGSSPRAVKAARPLPSGRRSQRRRAGAQARPGERRRSDETGEARGSSSRERGAGSLGDHVRAAPQAGVGGGRAGAGQEPCLTAAKPPRGVAEPSA